MRVKGRFLALILAIGGCSTNSGIDCVADDVCYKECARDPDCKTDDDNNKDDNDNSNTVGGSGWTSGDEPAETTTNPACSDGGMSSDINVVGGSKISNLSGCLSINGTLRLERTSLTTVDGLSEIRSIAGALVIHDNADLENLSGLENLTEIGGDLSINYNPKLADVSALGHLESVGGDLILRGNGALASLNGLIALVSIGGNIYIRANPDLTSLAELAALESIGGDVMVSQNRSLPTCEAGGSEQSLIQRVHVPGEIVICENAADACGSDSCPENW